MLSEVNENADHYRGDCCPHSKSVHNSATLRFESLTRLLSARKIHAHARGEKFSRIAGGFSDSKFDRDQLSLRTFCPSHLLENRIAYELQVLLQGSDVAVTCVMAIRLRAQV